MLKGYYFIVFGLITCLLCACGGGGSSDSSPSEGQQTTTQTDTSAQTETEVDTSHSNDIQPPLPPRSYSGINTPAKLSRQSAIDFVEVIYRLVGPVHSLASSVFDPFTTKLLYVLRDNSDSSSDPDEFCSSGELNTTDQLVEQFQTLIFEYKQCEFEGTTFNGRLFYEIDYASETLTLNFEDFSASSLDETIRYSGIMEYTESGETLVESFLVSSDVLNIEYWTPDLRIKGGSFSGSFYRSDFGSVQVEFLNEQGTLHILGSDNSTVEGLLSSSEGARPRTYDMMSLIYQADTASLPLYTDIPVANILIRPYLENSAPEVVIDKDLSVDRLATAELDARRSQDPDFDFVSYEWRHISGPESCEYELSNEFSIEASFVSQCQGLHEIEVSAFDGITTSTSQLYIDVIPLPARLSPTSNQTYTSAQSLDIQINVENLIEDGPFSFDIAYAPQGISVDGNGLVTGIPKAFIKDGNGQFNISIEVGNGRSSYAEFSVDFPIENKEKSLLTNMQICTREFLQWSDIDGNGYSDLVCPYNESYALLEMRDGTIHQSYVELLPFSFGKLLSVAQADVNDDQIDEILLAYEDGLFVVDGQSKQLLHRLDVPTNLTDGSLRSMALYPIPYAFNGFVLFLNGHEDEGYYLYDLNTPQSYKKIDNASTIAGIGNFDEDSDPELVLSGGREIYDFDSSIREIGEAVDYVMDFNGDGKDDLIRVSGQDDYFTREFTIELIDPVSLTINRNISVAIPDGYDNVWGGELFIHNVDDDDEKEVILHFGSISKLFVFQINRDTVQLAEEAIISEHANSPFSVFTQVSSRHVAFGFNAYNFNLFEYSFGENISGYEIAHPSWVTHLHDRVGLSRPFVQTDGSVNLYFKDVQDREAVARVNMTEDGEINDIDYFHDIVAPYGMNAVLEASVSSSDSDELVVARGFEREHRVYDLSSGQLVMETDFDTGLSMDAELIPVDINNDGVLDIIANGNVSAAASWRSPISWFDPLENAEIWSLQGDIDSYHARASNVLVSDIDNDNASELLTFTSRRLAGRELHIYRHTGSNDLERVFVQSIGEQGLSSEVMGLQDVDGDGKQEIIIVMYRGTCEPNDASVIEIIDDDFSPLAKVDVDVCVNRIPSIDATSAKRNIIVSGPAHSSNHIDYIRSRPYSRFMEIDARFGNIIWESKEFFGELDQKSFISFGNDVYDSKKGAVLRGGYYSFE